MRTITRLAAGAVVAGASLALPLTANAAGVTGPAFYVEGELYRTVITKTDLPASAPDRSFDNIYAFPMGTPQPNVADAAPGVGDFNGGRWQVHALAYVGMHNYADLLASSDLNGNEIIDTVAEVHDGIDDGILVDTGIVKRFVCTVNPVPANG